MFKESKTRNLLNTKDNLALLLIMGNSIKIIRHILKITILIAFVFSVSLYANEVVLNDQEKALFEAVEKGEVETIEELANAGVDLDVKNEHGETALHRAATLGNLRVIETLYLEGAYIQETNRSGETPRDTARFNGNLQAKHLLKDLELQWALDNGVESEFPDEFENDCF